MSCCGRSEGATLTTGGGVPKDRDRGWFVEPTVFADVDNRSPMAREEIFGPVLSVIPYADEDEAVALANDSEYGLGGTVWTSDRDRGVGVARRVETGSFGVNRFDLDWGAPFGGVKSSGIGRELGPEGLDRASPSSRSSWVRSPRRDLTRSVVEGPVGESPSTGPSMFCQSIRPCGGVRRRGRRCPHPAGSRPHPGRPGWHRSAAASRRPSRRHGRCPNRRRDGRRPGRPGRRPSPRPRPGHPWAPSRDPRRGPSRGHPSARRSDRPSGRLWAHPWAAPTDRRSAAPSGPPTDRRSGLPWAPAWRPRRP